MIEETLLDELKATRNKLPLISAVLTNGEIDRQKRKMINRCIETIKEEIDNYIERDK